MPKKTKQRFFNRELSWVEFNFRVLNEGLRHSNPLLERLKFLSIVSSNFDEFFMVRVANLKRQIRGGSKGTCPTGMSPEEQYEGVTRRVREIIGIQYRCLLEDILPGLAKKGIRLVRPAEYSSQQLEAASSLFNRDIFTVLTPVRVPDDQDFPVTGNLRLHAAFLVEPLEKSGMEPAGLPLLAIVQVPPTLNRIIWLPDERPGTSFTLLEDIVIQNAPKLFPGFTIREVLLFRVTRDADTGVDEDVDEDFMDALEEILIGRQHSLPVRLEVSGESASLKERLAGCFGLDPGDVYDIPGPVDLKAMMGLTFLAGHDDLHYEPWDSYPPPGVQEEVSLWDTLKQEDILLHHPYTSFDAVLRFVEEASNDPDVLAIKMTLYRTSGDSPVIKALARAAENGKQVTVLVELKARFDEERNITWAQRLEHLGALVIYGIQHLKVHAKALLVVRREQEGIRRYVHLGTGNYNDNTAKYYTDMGLMSSSEELTYETTLFFNTITGYSTIPDLRKLIMAPVAMKDRLLALIGREAERSSAENPGLIMVKINSLADPDIIRALYGASKAGVKIKLNVRGVCMLVPGIKRLSENIEVVSIVGRFLEHSRIFYFYNAGVEEIYLSSADWMPRNLERRVELMFPVEQNTLKRRLKEILEIYFRDNQNAHRLNKSGEYERKKAEESEKGMSCQLCFHEDAKKCAKTDLISPQREFQVRRSPPASSHQA